MSQLITVTYPWEVLDATEHTSGSTSPKIIPWQPHVIAREGAPLQNAVSGKPFPGYKIDNDLTVFEIHGPAIRGELSHGVSLSAGNGPALTLSYQHEEDSGAHLARLKKFEPFFDQMMDSMLHVLREGLKNEKFKLETHYWSELIELLAENNHEDPAKYSLVVDLARPKTLVESLHRVTDRPKRILRRIHDQERVQKVREIDTKCVTDLAKRPGSAIAEKAGPKQRILAIRRTESIDTLENRVARHCCELLNTASRRYLNKHAGITPEKSKRVESVHKLQRIALQVPRKESFQGVTRLIQPCRQPNYTLLQNGDYYKVWAAYVELVRNEDLRNQLWMWSRRFWADYMIVYLSSILQAFVEKLGPDIIQLLGHKTVLSERRHEMGRWLLDDCLPGPFIVNPQSVEPLSLYLVDGSQNTLSNLTPELESLSRLNADILILASGAGKLKVLPIYALLPSHHLEEAKHLEYIDNILPGMMKAVRKFNLGSKSAECIGSWVMLGNWNNNNHPNEVKNLRENLTCWLTSVPSDSRLWTSDSSKWEQPLLSICGV